MIKRGVLLGGDEKKNEGKVITTIRGKTGRRGEEHP